MTNLSKYLSDYNSAYNRGMNGLDYTQLELAIKAIERAYDTDKTVFVAGNGGSAAISNHLCCDFMKGFDSRVVSLSCNTPLITAIANDLGYKETISYQLDHLLNDGDILILISSSGNSENIIEALDRAKRTSNLVIGLTGFSGGKLMLGADISLHIPIANYGVVEDCHQSIMHIISQYIYKERGFNVSF